MIRTSTPFHQVNRCWGFSSGGGLLIDLLMVNGGLPVFLYAATTNF